MNREAHDSIGHHDKLFTESISSLHPFLAHLSLWAHGEIVVYVGTVVCMYVYVVNIFKRLLRNHWAD